MARETPRILDCTIRDGGLINDHRFTVDFVRRAWRGVSQAGVEFFEIGYRNRRDFFPLSRYGVWKSCRDEDILEVTSGTAEGAGIVVMVDVGRADLRDFRPASESPVSLVRISSYVKDIAAGIRLENALHNLGYRTVLNLIALSRDDGPELDDVFRRCEAEFSGEAVYLVDSFGALAPDGVKALIARARKLLSRPLGFHGHNNLQLAFANTLTAAGEGVSWLDASLAGMGRASGNCPLELLLGQLRPHADLRPVLDLLAQDLLPLRRTCEWGYVIPYALTGLFGCHPRPAMERRRSAHPDDYRDFYDELASRAAKGSEVPAREPSGRGGSSSAQPQTTRSSGRS